MYGSRTKVWTKVEADSFKFYITCFNLFTIYTFTNIVFYLGLQTVTFS